MMLRRTPVAILLLFTSMPAMAVDPDGNYSLTFDYLVAAEWDFWEGVGIYEPGGPNNPCPGQRLLGLRAIQPLSHYYQAGRVASNLDGPAFRFDGLSPIGLAPCPVPTIPPQDPIEAWFHGFDLHVAFQAMSSELNLCSQLIQSTDGGCIPSPETVDLDVAACPWANAAFAHDNLDGKPDFGVWDVLASTLSTTIWSEAIACGSFPRSRDYSPTVTDFGVNYAAQGFDIIQNADIVHLGSGDAYAVICWNMDYVNLDGIDANGDGDTDDVGDTPAGSVGSAAAHDYQLILDVDSAPGIHTASLAAHFGGPTELLRGLYSTAPGAGAGNGSPCSEAECALASGSRVLVDAQTDDVPPCALVLEVKNDGPGALTVTLNPPGDPLGTYTIPADKKWYAIPLNGATSVEWRGSFTNFHFTFSDVI